MTKEEIIRLARGANLPSCHTTHPKALERFAALVAAAERNKLAQWMVSLGYATGHGDAMEDLLEELEWQVTESWSKVVVASVEAERELIAQSMDKQADLAADEIDRQWAQEMAAAIRARGEK